MERSNTDRQEAAEVLGRLQNCGQGRAGELGVRDEDIAGLVERTVANPDPQARTDARLLCSQIIAPYLIEGPIEDEAGFVELLVRALASGIALELEYPGLSESIAQMGRGEGRMVRSRGEQSV